MNNKFFKTGILIATLGIPVFVFLFLKFFGENKFDLPYYFPQLDQNGEVIISEKDTVFTKVPNFLFLSQDSTTYNSTIDTNKIRVLGFFFSRCGTICPVINKNVDRLAEKFNHEDNLKFLMISIDPNFDRPFVLKKYREGFSSKSKNWLFLTGNKKDIYDFAIKGVKLPVADASEYDKGIKSVDETFIHSEKLLLIDKSGYIRGIYDGTNTADINRLDVEIKVLLNQKQDIERGY
jgi:protein SCO1/2